MTEDHPNEINNCWIDYPRPFWPTYPTPCYGTVYICDGCSNRTYVAIHCYVKGKFGYYCSVECAEGKPRISFTYNNAIDPILTDWIK